MTKRPADEQCAANTDREIWREREGDYYADSIHVTDSGGIGINCGGHVIVAPIRKWHASLRAQEGMVMVPRELYDSCGIYVELGINSDIRPQQVDAVLHAAIRLIRKNAAAQNAGNDDE